LPAQSKFGFVTAVLGSAKLNEEIEELAVRFS